MLKDLIEFLASATAGLQVQQDSKTGADPRGRRHLAYVNKQSIESTEPQFL